MTNISGIERTKYRYKNCKIYVLKIVNYGNMQPYLSDW